MYQAIFPSTRRRKLGSSTNVLANMWDIKKWKWGEKFEAISTFFFSFSSSGNVWVYSIYEPIYVKNATTTEVYCNKTLYLYAFWTMTITYICICLFLPLALCCCLCACICNKSMFGSFGARVPTNPAPLWWSSEMSFLGWRKKHLKWFFSTSLEGVNLISRGNF